MSPQHLLTAQSKRTSQATINAELLLREDPDLTWLFVL